MSEVTMEQIHHRLDTFRQQSHWQFDFGMLRGDIMQYAHQEFERGKQESMAELTQLRADLAAAQAKVQEVSADAERENSALRAVCKKYIGWFALKDGQTVEEVLARELADPEMTGDAARAKPQSET